MSTYNSKYFTNEQIDQRLLQGYYDDAVTAGYTGTKTEFLEALIEIINQHESEDGSEVDYSQMINISDAATILLDQIFASARQSAQAAQNSAEEAAQKVEELGLKINQGSGSEDLNITDEAGHVLMRLEGGHIKTKNFDSSSIGTSKHLKICILGNSYTADSWMYLPFILKNYGITIEVGCYIRSSGTIQNAIDEWNTGSSSVSSAFYYINTKNNESPAWQTVSTHASPLMSVTYTNWDIVVLQQSSEASITYDTYTVARTLENLIIDNIGKDVMFGWNINHNRKSSGTDYEAIGNTILSNTSKICEREPISILFPYGTAIFNARTNNTLAAIGDGTNLWCSDKVHLQEGLPCYIANLANVQALFDRFYPHLSVVGDITRPTTANITAWAVKSTNGSSTGVTEANCKLAQVCAVLANNYPFEIHNIYE